MLKGISNLQIENTIKTINDEDLSNNFVGVFPSDKMTKFMAYKQLINKKTGKYPFLISNTDGLTKSGEHWWSILQIEPKKDLFFLDLFGYDGLKNFIVTDDKKTVQKILNGIETMDRKDNKLKLVKIKFSVKAYKNFSDREIEKLNDTAMYFFYFIKSFADFFKSKQLFKYLNARRPYTKH